MIRPVTTDDAEAIAGIYNHYIESTAITFEEASVSVDEMSSRMGGSKSDLPWLVYELDGTIVGYAYAGQWNERGAYRHSCEVSIYLDHDAVGKGIGRRLYRHLIVDLRQRGMHVIIGGVALPNPASVALHESFGFEKVAHYREVGRKFGKWIDVGYWQLTLDQAISADAEERSPDPSPSQ